MTLAPLLAAPLAIQVHAFAAFALVQLSLPKGSARHRLMGRCWVTLMGLVAGSSFFIHTMWIIGPFSPIHALSIFTLAVLPIGVLHARRHRVPDHLRKMLLLFIGAPVVARVLTLSPGRIMHDVAFGTHYAHGSCS